jgi:hypothetical protein
MIREYADGAASRAGARAIELRATGQLDAADIWLRVKAAIEKLED